MFSSLSDYDWRYLLVTGLYARCPKNMRLYRFYKKYFSHKLKFVQNCLCLLDRERRFFRNPGLFRHSATAGATVMPWIEEIY